MLEVPLASSFGLGPWRDHKSNLSTSKLMAVMKAAIDVGLTCFSCPMLKAATASHLYPVRAKTTQQQVRPGAVEKLLNYCFSSSVERKKLKVTPSIYSERMRTQAGQNTKTLVTIQDCLLVVRPKLHSGTLSNEHVLFIMHWLNRLHCLAPTSMHSTQVL